MDGSLSEGGSLWLADESPTLGSTLSLGRSLSEVDSDSLADDGCDPLGSLIDPEADSLSDSEIDALPETDVLSDWLADSETLADPEWLSE